MHNKTVFMILVASLLMLSAQTASAKTSLQDLIVEKNGLILSGDTNGDYVVDRADIDEIGRLYKETTLSADDSSVDLNGDGIIDVRDLAKTGIGYGSSLFGESYDNGGSTTLFVNPSFTSVEPGNIFNVYVTIDTTENIFAVSLVVSYDKNILNATSVSEGPFLGSDGESTYTINPIIDWENGLIQYDSTRFETNTSVSGAGNLFGITFEALAEGTGAVTIEDQKLVEILPNGSYVFINGGITINDGTVEVNVNEDPVIDPIADKTVNEGSLLQFDVTVTDGDGDDVDLTVGSGPGSMTDNTYTYNALWDTNHIDEVYILRIDADDGNGGTDSESFQLTVTDVNRAPSIDSYTPTDTTPSVDEGSDLQFTVEEASDGDGDSLSYEWMLDGGIVSTASSYTYSPSYSDSGPHTVIVTVSDGHGGTDTQSWAVTVNDVPITCTKDSDCGTDGYVSEPFCSGLDILRTYRTYTCSNPGTPSASCSSSDSNILIDTCSYKCISGFCVSNVAPTIDSFAPPEDPTIDEDDDQGFSITASDLYGDPLTIVWRLDGVDVGTGSSYTYHSDFTSADIYTVLVRVSDDGGLYDTHTWTLTVNDVPITCTKDSDCGTDGYVSEPFCSGLDILRTYRTYTCSNPGTPSASCSSYDSDKLITTCADLCQNGACVSNNDPVIDPIADKSVYEGSTLTFTVTASDPDGDDVTLSKTSGPGTLSGSTYTHTPSWDTNHESEVYTVVIEATDGRGGSDSESFQLTVNDVNRAPVINSFSPADKTPSVDEGESIGFSVSASDPEGDYITYLWKLDGSDEKYGNTYSYNPGYDDAGDHVIEVVASDDSLMDTESWTVTVNDVQIPDTYEQYLFYGANTVNIPSAPENTEVTAVLSSVASKYDVVRVYDPSIECNEDDVCEGLTESECEIACDGLRWLIYNPTRPPFLNTLHEIDGTLPFYITMNQDALLVVDLA